MTGDCLMDESATGTTVSDSSPIDKSTLTTSEKVALAQLDAWKKFHGMSSKEAKKHFLVNLLVIAPSWDYKTLL